VQPTTNCLQYLNIIALQADTTQRRLPLSEKLTDL